MTSPPGGGMRDAAEAGEQRAGEQERGADALGQLAVDDRLVGGQVGGAERDLVLATAT